MKKIWALPVAALLLALSINPAHAGDHDSPHLAFELASMRDAWLYGDDATAAARLDTLRRDDRLSGEFPHWYASLRAVLALKQGDAAKALEVLQPVLDDSQDARNYVRDARLLVAYGHQAEALKVIESGLRRAPTSQALLRYRAGLQWLQGDFDGALKTYVGIIVGDDRPQYPFVTANGGDWSKTRPWSADDNRPTMPASDDDNEFRDGGGNDTKQASSYEPEPFTSLFMPLYWYACDLPGLDRCLNEMAGNAEATQAGEDALDGLLKTARESQQALDDLRSSDEKLRAKVNRQAAIDRWNAVLTLRVIALSRMNDGDWEGAEAALKRGLALSSEDVALLDLMARVYGHTGKAEEARSVVLSRLQNHAGLAIDSSTLFRSPDRQMMDRVFEPALALYRANPQAGLAQMELMRTGFANKRRNQPVSNSLLGLWLYKHGETDLARKDLVDASRLNGYESGKPIYGDTVLVEMALVALGDQQADDTTPPGKKDEKAEDEKRPAKEPGKEEKKAVEVAKLDSNTNPLLRKSLRAGAVLGSCYDVRARMQRLLGVDVYAAGSAIGSARAGAKFLPDGEALLQEIMWGMPAEIADKVPAKDIDAFLAPDHKIGKLLTQGLDTMGELAARLSTNDDDWRTRESLGEKAGPVLGMIEARALLLRAKLIQQKPKDLAELTKWLDKYQSQIDVRTALKLRSSNAYTRMKQARQDAGIPEITHTGLALDAARLLARAGHPGDAARLLWLNRDAPIGVDSVQHMLAVASVLARKAGDDTLALRCRLGAFDSAPRRADEYDYVSGPDPRILLVELPQTRKDLLEFGGKADLLDYIENHLMPTADSNQVGELLRTAPELRKARPTLFMRNTVRYGLGNIFAASVTAGNCSVIERNWAKMMAGPDSFRSCERFAAWIIASDLPLDSNRRSYTGLINTRDMLRGWTMLLQLYKRMGANDPRALTGADYMDKLLDRISGSLDDNNPNAGDDEDWWG